LLIDDRQAGGVIIVDLYCDSTEPRGEKIMCSKIYIFLYSHQEHVREWNRNGIIRENVILDYKLNEVYGKRSYTKTWNMLHNSKRK